MNTISRWLVAGVACAVIFVSLAAFKYFQVQAAIAFGESYPEPSESVEAVVAAPAAFERSFSTIGEIVAPQSLELRNEVEGVIAAVNFASGDRVKKGDVLVQLDVSEESARLDAAEAKAKLAKLDLDRMERLVQQKTVSRENVDQAEAGYAIAKAEVQALKATIAKKTLRAPFDAIAGIHSLDEGEFLQSNTLVVGLVGINDYSWVDFNLPLGQANIQIGNKVGIQIPGGKLVPAKVIATNAMASASSRNVTVRARTAKALPLRPNTVVKVTVEIGNSNLVQVPRGALLVDEKGDFVYVLEKNQAGEGYRAKRQPVVVGEQNADVATLVSGLNEGDLVAAQGAFKLMPGLLTFVRERIGAEATAVEPQP
jgi:membrane fusion protein, multidrug efflux system